MPKQARNEKMNCIMAVTAKYGISLQPMRNVKARLFAKGKLWRLETVVNGSKWKL
jgi:hypothetical protein